MQGKHARNASVIVMTDELELAAQGLKGLATDATTATESKAPPTSSSQTEKKQKKQKRSISRLSTRRRRGSTITIQNPLLEVLAAGRSGSHRPEEEEEEKTKEAQQKPPPLPASSKLRTRNERKQESVTNETEKAKETAWQQTNKASHSTSSIRTASSPAFTLTLRPLMSSLFDFLDCLPPPLLPSASSSDSSSHYRQHQFFSSTTKKTGSHRYCWSINEEVGMQQLRLRLKEMVNQVKAILVELKQQLPLKVFASTRDVLISLALTMKYQVKEVIEAVKGYCNQQDVGKQLPQRRLITSSFFLVTATYDIFIAIERISAAVEMEGLIEQMARHILSMLHLINHTNNDKSERKQSRRIDSLPNQILLSCEKLLNAAAIRRCDVPYPLLQHDLSEKIKLVDEAVTSFVLLAQKFLQEEDTIAQTEATRSRRAQLKELSVKIASDLKHYVDTYTSATAISCSSSDSFLKDETPPRVFMQLGEQTLREVEQDSSLWEQVMTNNEAQMMNFTRSLISLFSDEDILSSWWRGREDSPVRQVITTADAIFALAFQQQKQHEEQSLTVSSTPPSSAVASSSPERKMQLQRACSWHQLRDTKQEQAHFRQGLQHFIQVIELAERRAWLEQRARLVEKKDEADLWWRTGQHLLTERMLCGGMQGIATACSLVVRQFFLSSLVASSSSTSNTIVKELLVAKEEDDEETEPLTQPKNEQLNNTEAEKEAKEQEQETPKKDVDKVLEMLRQKQKEIASGGESSARRVAGSRRARFRAAAAANGSGSGNGGENGRATPSGARRRAGSQAGKQLLTSFFHSTDVMTFEEYNVTI